MNFVVGPPVQNPTEMDENTPKRNGILTMAQMTQFDPQNSKITSVSSSDENSTFPHFWHGSKKSWKNLNWSIAESNFDDLWLDFELDFDFDFELDLDS